MANSEAKTRANKKYIEDKKNIAFYAPKELAHQFDEKLKHDKLSKTEVLTTAIHQYINGELRVNKIK